MLIRARAITNALTLLLCVPSVLFAQNSRENDAGGMSRAQFNWTMHCQGCHGENAQGTPDGAPAMAGSVARFLHIKAGRAYLGRVPGVAFADLSDGELAELLNWVVQHFDGGDLPKPFAPYSAKEIGALRRNPLISRAAVERQRLLRLLSLDETRRH